MCNHFPSDLVRIQEMIINLFLYSVLLYNVCNVCFQPMLVIAEAGSQHSLVPSSHTTLDKEGETDNLTLERLPVTHFRAGGLLCPHFKTKHIKMG